MSVSSFLGFSTLDTLMARATGSVVVTLLPSLEMVTP